MILSSEQQTSPTEHSHNTPVEAEPTSANSSTGSVDVSLLSDEAVVLDSDCLPSQDVEIEAAEELISSQTLTQLFIRSCSRRNFAVWLVRSLFDETTRMNSNVAGKNKDKLNPQKMSYIKAKCFEYYPLSGQEKEKEEWANCIISIDESGRRLKNKPKKRVQTST